VKPSFLSPRSPESSTSDSPLRPPNLHFIIFPPFSYFKSAPLKLHTISSPTSYFRPPLFPIPKIPPYPAKDFLPASGFLFYFPAPTPDAPTLRSEGPSRSLYPRFPISPFNYPFYYFRFLQQTFSSLHNPTSYTPYSGLHLVSNPSRLHFLPPQQARTGYPRG
jgi:hypothetical protein